MTADEVVTDRDKADFTSPSIYRAYEIFVLSNDT